MIKTTNTNGWLRGFDVARNGGENLEITHLQYADDTLIMFEVEEENVISAKYEEEDNWMTKDITTPYGVCLWRSIRALWSEFKTNTKIKVANGGKTNFWKDEWHETGRLDIQFPDIYALVSHQQKTIADLWTHQGWTFNFMITLNQWLHQNMETVVSMYEDRFDLCTIQSQLVEVSSKNKDQTINWWKKLSVISSRPVSRQLNVVVIDQISVPVKRTKELRALTGWRYYYSLFLELADIAMPLVRIVIAKACKSCQYKRKRQLLLYEFLLRCLLLHVLLLEVGTKEKETYVNQLLQQIQNKESSLVRWLEFPICNERSRLQATKMENLSVGTALTYHSSSSTTATINLMNSKKIHRSSRTSPSSSRDTRRQFEASEHAVPSGPNPSSN
ncbi:putative programmed cell death protein 5-like [Capsicum annuum]|nr:putative programmed cell death protein 5-like [Capsicum annuum]